MALTRNRTKSNPINIAPFVDILLVLFVILVIVARFDGVSKAEAYIQKNKKLEKIVKELYKNIYSLKTSLDASKKTKSKLEKDSKKLLRKFNNQSKNSVQLEDLVKKIKQLQTKNTKIQDENRDLSMKLKDIKNNERSIKSDKVKLLKLNEKLTKRLKNNNLTKQKLMKLQKKIDVLTATLKIVRDELLSYKNEPKRKDDLYISIDKKGQIWLVDAITRVQLIKISFKNFKQILASLTFANVKYFYFPKNAKSAKTLALIRQTTKQK